MDEITLTLMTAEIAAVLKKHLLDQPLKLESGSVKTRSKTCAQVFASNATRNCVFSISTELRHPPPLPSKLRLQCFTQK
ncbi:MAG: hypothetical protein BWK73_41140 [Thiothrix lacustris]|uniref:Uncharacterized protein n=1 Tax=Thiothrix lacustris TaxID=525917 RepID=A0A1Y1QDI4_9GAMM|nr:MAG: hypothetical protein BWK73_41140 [Thiothrix lacustris]